VFYECEYLASLVTVAAKVVKCDKWLIILAICSEWFFERLAFEQCFALYGCIAAFGPAFSPHSFIVMPREALALIMPVA
jgi:hypothetical protein